MGAINADLSPDGVSRIDTNLRNSTGSFAGIDGRCVSVFPDRTGDNTGDKTLDGLGYRRALAGRQATDEILLAFANKGSAQLLDLVP